MKKSKWTVSKVTKQIYKNIRDNAIIRGNQIHKDIENKVFNNIKDNIVVKEIYFNGNTSARLCTLDFNNKHVKKENEMQNTIEEQEEQFNYFIGVKLIAAISMTKGDAFLLGHYKSNIEFLPQEEKHEPGYVIDYGNYQSWSPKDVFESAYFPIADKTKISASDVMSFLVQGEGTKLGEKTTVVLDSTITGFDMIGTSACVDPNNYSQEIGEEIARRDITNKIWEHLGFVLQWAKNGLKYKANS